MSKNIFISYIVPCYNVQAYLPRCLESLSKQRIDSGEEVEFVLVNDGSPDNCLELLRDFVSKETRAVLIDQTNRGVSSARNAGINKAQGKYIFFLDADDFLIDNASQLLYNECKEYDVEIDIIIPNAYIYKEGAWNEKKEWRPCQGIKTGIYKPLDFATKVKKLPQSFKAYKREMLISNNVFYSENLRVGEVLAFFLNAMTCSQYVLYTDMFCMNYVVRKTSVMRTINLERDATIIQTMHQIDDYTNEHMPQLRNLPSYKRTLLDIVNVFGIIHYTNYSPYSQDIGNVLVKIKNDDIYKDLLNYFIYEERDFNRRTLHSLLMHFPPISLSYRLIRLFRRARMILKNTF